MYRWIPNVITFTRMVLCVILFFIETMDTVFMTLYVTAFLTDIADGNLARLTGTCSELGKTLDSIADLLFLFVVVIKILPWMDPGVLGILWILLLVIIRLSANIIVYHRTGKYVLTHSIPNKITSFMIFFIAFMYLWFGTDGFIISMAVMTVCALIELFSVNKVTESYLHSSEGSDGKA